MKSVTIYICTNQVDHKSSDAAFFDEILAKAFCLKNTECTYHAAIAYLYPSQVEALREFDGADIKHSMEAIPATGDPNPIKTQYPTPHFGVDLATGPDHHSEVTWASEAGFVKTPEQMELIEQQAFENGHRETLRDAKAGLYAKSEELYNATQVKMLINEALRKHDQTTVIVLKKLQGMYKLPDAVDALIRDLELNKEEVNCG